MIGAERTGGVESSSMLGETMRRGMRMPGCQSPMCEWRIVGVCISMPATERRLSWDVDFRRLYCICKSKTFSEWSAMDWEYSPDGEDSDSSGIEGCWLMPSHKSRKAGRSY